MKERIPHKLRIYICNSGEYWLIVNGDEQLDTTEIDPAVRSVAVRHSVACELRPTSTAQGLNCHPHIIN